MPRSKVHKAILVRNIIFKGKLDCVTSEHQIIRGVGWSSQAAGKFVSMLVGTVAIERTIGGNSALFTDMGEFAGGLAESADCWTSSVGFLSFEASSINKAFVVAKSHTSPY
jgi:hypothetical protein